MHLHLRTAHPWDGVAHQVASRMWVNGILLPMLAPYPYGLSSFLPSPDDPEEPTPVSYHRGTMVSTVLPTELSLHPKLLILGVWAPCFGTARLIAVERNCCGVVELVLYANTTYYTLFIAYVNRLACESKRHPPVPASVSAAR